MEIKIINNIDSLELKLVSPFILKHPQGNFFQSIKAFEFFKAVENYNPLFFLAIDSGEIVGSLLAFITKEKKLLKGFLSRRCIVYGGPIVKDNCPEIAQSLLNAFDKAIKKKVIYSEFRAFFDLNTLKTVFEKNGYEFHEHLNFIVPIISEEENKKLLNSSKRRQISLSLRNGAEIIEARDLEDVKSFYDILYSLYKTKVKKPLPDINFFENFFNNKSLGKIFIIKNEEKILGGIVCPIYKDRIFEWFVCGLDGEIKNVYPSVLATWAPIQYAIDNGLKYFDFLGAGKPEEEYGVREFKAKFGGQLVNLGRFVKVYKKQLYSVGKLGLKLIKKVK